MKFFGTDFGLKYIIAEVDGKEILVSFYENRRKGIHNISFRINKQERPAVIKDAYPGFMRKIQEAWIIIRVQGYRLKQSINRIAKRDS